MKYCTVTSSMSKKSVEVDSTNHMCAERQLIRRLYRECIRKGYKPHQFSEWVHRKYGHLIISRNTTYGAGISMPCVLCRKMIERYDICWMAYDGDEWMHSVKTAVLPQSIPTRKQKDVLGFGKCT